MRTERRRSPRFPFIAGVEITDERKDTRISSHIRDLSLHGCYVEMANPFPQGTNVRMEIYAEDESLETHATVAYVEPKQGMGVVFAEMPVYFTAVLHNWLAEAAGRQAN